MDLVKALVFLFTFFLTAIVYWPGLSGPFLFDDFPNLVALQNSGGVDDWNSARAFVFGNDSGPTGRPVAMATFLLDSNSWPANPWHFKLTNLLFHLLTGVMGFLAIRRFLVLFGKTDHGSLFWFPMVSVALWMIHPMNVSTVLYVVQRMAVLSALFSLASLFFYLKARSLSSTNAISKVSSYFLAAIFLIFGVFSKENAAQLIVFILALECFVFRDLWRSLGPVRSILFVISVLFLAILSLYFTYDYWGSGYSQRLFNVWQRLFYQVSALGDYVIETTFPILSNMNLFSGYYESAKSIVISTRFIIGAGTLLSLFAILLYSILRGWVIEAFALLWFFSFHLMESTVLPLELYFEHRNYMPGMGLIVFFVAISDRILRMWKVSLWVRSSMLAFICFFLSASTLIMAMTWSHPGTLFLKWEMDEPFSARAKVVYANYLDSIGFPDNAIEHLDRAIAIQPSALGLHLNKFEIMCRTGFGGDPVDAFNDVQDARLFDFGVTSQLEKILNNINSDGRIGCSEGAVSFDVERFFRIVEDAQLTKWNTKRAARYYSLKSDYYAKTGDLNAAVTAIDMAAKYQPSVDLYLKVSVMLASAGLYDDALDRLALAKTADERRRKFYPSRSEELQNLEFTIKNLM